MFLACWQRPKENIYLHSLFRCLCQNHTGCLHWDLSKKRRRIHSTYPTYLVLVGIHSNENSTKKFCQICRGRVWEIIAQQEQTIVFGCLLYLVYSGVSRNSRSRPFPRMKASDSHSRIMGMDFFIAFPSPHCGNGFFSLPSHSRICYFTDGNQNGNWITERYTRLPFFQLPLHFSKQLYWGEKLSQDV